MANSVSFGNIAVSNTIITSPSFGLTGNTAGVSTVSGNDIYLQGGDNITLSGTSNTIIISAASGGGGLTNVNISAGTTSNNLSALTFSNSNNFSFGLNGSVITASYTVPTVTNSSFSVQDSATTINPVARIAFSTGNNITLSISSGASSATVGVQHNLAGTSSGFGGNLISGSMTHNSSGLNLSLNHPAWLTTAMVSDAGSRFVNTSAGLNLTNISATFNSNSISLSVASQVAQTNQTIGLYAVSNTTQNSSTTLDARSLSFQGAGVASVGYSNGSVIVSVSAQTAAAAPVNISAGTTSNNLATIVFSNSNGVSFGLDGSTITASHNGLTSQSNQAFSAAGGSSAFQTLGFSDNGYVSWTNSNGSVAITELRGSFYADSNTTQGTSGTQNIDAITFAGAGAASVGITNGSIVVSTPENPIVSYYDNGVAYQGTTAFSMGGSSIFVQPFQLPMDISASYIRIANSWAFGSTTGGTTANTSLSLNNSQSIWVNIYTKGVGANSKSLQYIAGGSVSLMFQVRVEIGAGSNNQTVSHNFTYPSLEGAAQGNYATNYNVNSASYNISTTHLTSFNGSRWLDIPFATSLSAGEYWMAIAQSTATATSGAGGIAAVTARNTFVAISQINANIALMGVSSNMSTAPMRNGLGYWSTNSNGASTSSIGLASISSVANQPILPFQIIREI